MDPTLSDVEVISRSIRDPDGFGLLYERHGLAVRRYVVRRVGDDLGSDIAAEVFVRAFRDRGRFRRGEHESVLPWLLGIANNVIADHRRVERRRLAALQRMAADVADGLDPRDSGLGLELVAALRALPAVERDTLLIVVWGELTQGEAAMALGVPVGTVSSRIARARTRLSSTLRPSPRAPGRVQVNGETHV